MPNFEISPIRHTLDSKHSLTRDYKINPLPNFETIYQRSYNSKIVTMRRINRNIPPFVLRFICYTWFFIISIILRKKETKKEGGIDSISRLFHSSSSAFPCETSDIIRIAIPTLIVSIDARFTYPGAVNRSLTNNTNWTSRSLVDEDNNVASV